MRPLSYKAALIPVTGALGAVALLAFAGPASAAQPPVGLGTATSYVVLAGTTVTNTGPSVLNGDLGLSPGTATPGVNALPGPARVNGAQHVTDAAAGQAKIDLTTAYNDAAGRTPVTAIPADLTGRTLAPGIYAGNAVGLTGTVTLNGHNDPSAVFVFKAASTLITASNSRVALIGVNPCNVYWQVGSSATLGTNSHFVGTVMALSDISATTGATIQGRLFARNGAVTLDDNTISRANCAISNPSSTPPAATSSAPAGSPTAGSPTAGSPTAGSPTAGSPTAGTQTAGGPATPQRTNGTSGPATSAATTPNSTSTLTRRTTASSAPAIPPNVSRTDHTPLGQPPHLARTGTDSSTLLMGGLALTVLGGALTFFGRRRTLRTHPRHAG